ncbi:MAG TPA: hypothetical protein VHG91_03035 [Longimicrobium sp.]|nr:hypothetical protein [Longimicrobium sp.]
MSDTTTGNGSRGGGGSEPPAAAAIEKHLDMILAAIARMAGNAFAAKGWSVGAATALVAFAVEVKNPLLTLAALIPVLSFWGLDAYFLWLERRYRNLYDAVRADLGREAEVPRYLLDPHWIARHPEARAPTDRTHPLRSALAPFLAPSVSVVHGVVLLAVLATTAYLARSGEQEPEPSRVQVQDTVNVRLLPAPGPSGAVQGDTVARPVAAGAARGG